MLKANYQTPGTPGYINSMNKVGLDGKVTFRWQADIGLSLESGAFVTFDWQTKVDVSKGLSVTGGIRNLFDCNPPFTINDQAGTSNARGYDARYASPLGRTFYASLGYKF